MRFNTNPLALIALLSCLTTLLWLGNRDFASRGEAREILAAQSVLDGNVLLPRGYGEVVASKPPLLHWAVAALALFPGRITEFAGRAPSGLASLLFLVLFYAFVRQRTGHRLALLAAFLLMGSVEWFRLGIECRVDMLHSTLVAGALLCIYAWYEKSFAGFPLLGILLLWCAVLSKGPVGIILPALVFVAFSWQRGIRWKKIAAKGLLIFGPALALGSLWYIAAAISGGREFGEKFFYENIARFTSTMSDSPHRHSVLYLLGTLLLGTMPWVILLIPDFIAWPLRPLILHLFNSLVSVKESFRWLRVRLRIRRRIGVLWGRFAQWFSERTAIEAFSLITVAVVFVFYSIPAGKRGAYLLPMYPFLSLLAATYFLRMGLRQRRGAALAFVWLCRAVVLAYAVIFALLTHMVPVTWLPPRSLAQVQYAIDVLTAAGASSAPALAALALPLLIAFFQSRNVEAKRIENFLPGLTALTFSGFLAVHAVLSPAFVASVSPRSFSQQIAPVTHASPLYSFGNEFYALSFYMHKPMRTLTGSFTEGMQIVLYERKLDSLRASIPRELTPKVLLRSAHGIVEPLERLVLVRLSQSQTGGS